MSKERTIQGIKEFFDNEEILKYPNLEYSSFTRKSDPTYFRIFKKRSTISVIGIYLSRKLDELNLYVL